MTTGGLAIKLKAVLLQRTNYFPIAKTRDFSLSFSFPGHARAEGGATTVSGDFSLPKSSQKHSSKSKVIGGNSYQFAECITPNLGYKR